MRKSSTVSPNTFREYLRFSFFLKEEHFEGSELVAALLMVENSSDEIEVVVVSSGLSIFRRDRS